MVSECDKRAMRLGAADSGLDGVYGEYPFCQTVERTCLADTIQRLQR